MVTSLLKLRVKL